MVRVQGAWIDLRLPLWANSHNIKISLNKLGKVSNSVIQNKCWLYHMTRFYTVGFRIGFMARKEGGQWPIRPGCVDLKHRLIGVCPGPQWSFLVIFMISEVGLKPFSRNIYGSKTASLPLLATFWAGTKALYSLWRNFPRLLLLMDICVATTSTLQHISTVSSGVARMR